MRITKCVLATALTLLMASSVSAQSANHEVETDTISPESSSQTTGSVVVDGVAGSRQHYTCETVTTDPRFDGVEEIVLIAYGAGAAGGPWTAEAVLAQDKGSWGGKGVGVWDAGASPLGTPGVPFNYGEMTYTGEGAYEGLVLHYYVAGTDEELALMGWIAPVE